MTTLSPAAQAVINRTAEQVLADRRIKIEHIAAAALRAAVEQVVPSDEREPYVPDYPDSNQIAPWHEWMERKRISAELLAIATELETHQ